jgi:hypothetical protein
LVPNEKDVVAVAVEIKLLMERRLLTLSLHHRTLIRRAAMAKFRTATVIPCRSRSMVRMSVRLPRQPSKAADGSGEGDGAASAVQVKAT